MSVEIQKVHGGFHRGPFCEGKKVWWRCLVERGVGGYKADIDCQLSGVRYEDGGTDLPTDTLGLNKKVRRRSTEEVVPSGWE